MVSTDILLECLPPYRDEWLLINENQTVPDIIEEVLEAHQEFAPYYDNIALYFDGGSVKQICKRLQSFCEKNLKYKEETENDQTSGLPTGILIRGRTTGVDCKHYAGFCGGILDALNRLGNNIDWKYRFASYRLLRSMPHHVFIVVNDNDEEIIIDPTPESEHHTLYWQVDKKINSSDMALYRNIAGFDDEIVKQNAEETFLIPAGSDIFWANGQWWINNDRSIGASSVDPVSLAITATQTGISNLLNLSRIISNLFGGRPKSRAAQKIYQMFPLPANPSADDIGQVLAAIEAHYETEDLTTLDPEWKAAYADILQQYSNAYQAVANGGMLPRIVIPPIAGATTSTTQTNFPTGGNQIIPPRTTTPPPAGGSAKPSPLLLIGGGILLAKLFKIF